ncbi:methionyl-tRNA synthetase [Acaromyces ingoldii]|uniref:methionine--tRNA ligase n=1 Tax=Acaromyces ingoldii TaxID=215250 RepID=A0A316YKE6_9BASI|nr:methionyl-tRNA synthetase [Acaromyces ingoldii]PWN89546.1 methionyl-tRNA synthetase [Acaromyces ingoldii]
MASPFPVSLGSETASSRKVSSSDILVRHTKQDGKAATVLPEPGHNNVLITSALPYVNNVPHLGNIIGSTLSADVYARYSRSRGRNTLYICGTDEYGTATETKALEEGVSPQQLCDKYHTLHAQVYKWFNIGFDHFGRTTTPAQTTIAQHIFVKLHENGFLEERSMRQLWCPKDERFLADRYVEGICPKCSYDDARGDQCDKCGQLLDAVDLIKPRCKLCGSPPEERDSRHMFLRIDALQPETEAWARQAAEKGAWSSNGRYITESWFKEGLRPFSLTRDLRWGVPVPVEGMEGKVLYVWFDAPIGYPSITANYTDSWEKWWRDPDNVRLYQFMGKDNVRFHTVIFPSCLLGTREKWTKLHHISTTDYLQYESGKFSKSRNIGVFGDKAGTIGVAADVWRYYLLANRPENGDAHFSWREFIARNNGELLANLGNFVNRVLRFLAKKYDGVLPPIPEGLGLTAGPEPLEVRSEDEDKSPFATLIRQVNAQLRTYVVAMDAVRLRLGLQTALGLSQRGNEFLSSVGLDNKLFAERRAECDATMLLAVNLIYVLSAVFHPFMPETTDDMCRQLDAPPRTVPVEDRGIVDLKDDDEDGSSGGESSFQARERLAKPRFALDLLPGHKIGTPAHLFKHIDEKMEEEWRVMFGGVQSSTAAAAGGKKEAAAAAAPPMSKNKAAKLAKEAKKQKKIANPTPEYLELERQVGEQGETVRKLKEAQKKGGGGGGDNDVKQTEVDGEVSKLLKLKNELQALTDQLSSLEVKDGEGQAQASTA